MVDLGRRRGCLKLRQVKFGRGRIGLVRRHGASKLVLQAAAALLKTMPQLPSTRWMKESLSVQLFIVLGGVMPFCFALLCFVSRFAVLCCAAVIAGTSRVLGLYRRGVDLGWKEESMSSCDLVSDARQRRLKRDTGNEWVSQRPIRIGSDNKDDVR